MQDPRRGVRGLRGVVHAFEQDGELVAAEAGDRIGRADRDPQPACDLLQHLVSGRVAEAVVDGLEVVQIDEDDSDVREAALRAHQPVLDAILEKRAIGEVR